MTARALPPDLLAAFGLARRITGNDEAACASVEAAVAAPWRGPHDLLARSRDEARARRPGALPAAVTPRPPELGHLSSALWETVERVALRGMTVSEAAADLGLERREVVLRLRGGLLAARDVLVTCERERDHEADAAWGNRLGDDRAAGPLGDASRDRQPEAAPRPRVAA